MTVAELIALLQQASPNMEVCTEGCDCVGEAIGIHVDEEDNTVTIARNGWLSGTFLPAPSTPELEPPEPTWTEDYEKKELLP